jgi:hypothetical protein
MKKSILVIAVFAMTFISPTEIAAQKFSKLDLSPLDAASYPSSYKISDKVWRTGANEAAEITFYKDIMFGGKAVKAGTYSLFTIPASKGDWTVILSTARNVWGSYYYKQEEDVVRVPGIVTTSEKNIEVFSMLFDEDMTLKMGWENTVVSVSIVLAGSED